MPIPPDTDDQLRQIAALAAYGAKTGQFPGAQMMASPGTMPQPKPPGAPPPGPPPGGPPPPPPSGPPPGPQTGVPPPPQGGPPPGPPPQAGPQGAPPPPQATPQRTPMPAPMQAPPQAKGQGIMGFLNNPLVAGALSSYFNAISTPRYAGKGTLIGRAGLGFLSGMGEAEKALSEEEKAQLDLEKERQEVDATRRYNVATDNIGRGVGTDEDYIIAKAYEYKKDKEDREDVRQVNQINGTLFTQTHPGQWGALIGGAMQRSPKPFTQEMAVGVYDEGLKNPYKQTLLLQSVEKGQVDIDLTKQQIAASKQAAALEAAEVPEKKAGGELKQLELDWLKKQPADVQQQYFMGKGVQTEEWLELDPKDHTKILAHHYLPVGSPQPGPNYQKSKDYYSGVKTELAGAKRKAVTYMEAGDPTKRQTVDETKGETPDKLTNPVPWRAGATGKKVVKTFWDPAGKPHTIDLDVRLPPEDWSDRPPKTAKALTPEQLNALAARTSKTIEGDFIGKYGRRPEGLLVSSHKQAMWAAALDQFKKEHGIDPKTGRFLPGWAEKYASGEVDVHGETPSVEEATPEASPTASAAATPSESPTATATATPTATPTGTPSAAASPTAKLSPEELSARVEAEVKKGANYWSEGGHHGYRYPGQPPVPLD